LYAGAADRPAVASAARRAHRRAHHICDQAHLTRHFKRHTSMTPARFARSRAR